MSLSQGRFRCLAEILGETRSRLPTSEPWLGGTPPPPHRQCLLSGCCGKTRPGTRSCPEAFARSLSQLPIRAPNAFESPKRRECLSHCLWAPWTTPELMLKRRLLVDGPCRENKPCDQPVDTGLASRPWGRRGTGDWVRSCGHDPMTNAYVMKSQ